jgi:hypothetical protein
MKRKAWPQHYLGMPIENNGVLIGTLDHVNFDNPADFGQFFHAHMFVNASGLTWDCAVDVFAPQGHTIWYRILPSLDRDRFAPIASRANGHYFLDRNASSGALDYLRDPLLRGTGGCLFGPILTLADLISDALLTWIYALIDRDHPWIETSGVDAATQLANLVAGSERLYVFGARFDNPGHVGMHDVHMNQGNLPGTTFAKLNGIWQDGAVIVQKPGGELMAFLVHFEVQKMRTDSNGNGIP